MIKFNKTLNYMVDLLIPGPEGKIEAKYSHNKSDNSPIVLILHPDPSRGGSMISKFISYLNLVYTYLYIMYTLCHLYMLYIFSSDFFCTLLVLPDQSQFPSAQVLVT